MVWGLFFIDKVDQREQNLKMYFKEDDAKTFDYIYSTDNN